MHHQTLTHVAAPKQYSIPSYRVSLVRDSHVAAPSKQVRDARDVREVLVRYLGDTDREHFVVVLLDAKNHIIGIHTVAIGSLSTCIVHPREVFKAAILSNAYAIICGHNHPSGDPTPSAEDQSITQQLAEAGKIMGILLLDHIIVGDGSEKYYSFGEEGLV